ncbi:MULTISPECIES: hypothetical protein [unclassified Schlesneria]|uniref:hypothetical protein n=1 Tax=Schlesneria TaxID=656899 RepID=UPI002EDE76F4
MTGRSPDSPGEADNKQGRSTVPASQRTNSISGQYVVFGLILIGLTATALLFVYWDQQTKPFRSLREAIGRQFRHARPNVEGGREKGRGPWTLRVSMTVDFPPGEDSQRATEIVDQVVALARQNYDISKVERIEVNLIQFVPQELAKTRKFTRDPHESTQKDKGAAAEPDGAT